MKNITMPKMTMLASAMLSAFATPLVVAQEDAATSKALEVIEVTSQKRVQSLQDVPASITTLDGDKLTDIGLTQMEEMSDYVPNFTVSKSGQGYNIYMRGLGSGPNQGFEQTVGTYVDGIYRGRAVLMRSSFLDLAMVEVLRGPQGTLFGMNTTAGALNLTSKNATDDFEGYVKAYYVPEYNKTDIEGAVSGGLTDDLSARFAFKAESDDGYIENVVTGDNEQARDSIAARVTFDWDITDKLNANLKIQHDTDENKGRSLIVTTEPYLQAANTPQTNALLAGLQEYQFDHKTANTTPALGEKQFEESTSDHITLNIDYTMGEHTFNSVTGYQKYQLNGAKDQDSSARTLLYSPAFEEDYKQLSQEFRFTSPGGETLDYIVGAYFQSSELNYDETSFAYPLAFYGTRDYGVESDLWALFAQFDYKLSEKLNVSLGLRYTEETKKGHKQMAVYDPKTNAPLSQSALVTPPALAAALDAFGLPGLPGGAYQAMLGTQFTHLDPLLLNSNTQNIVNPVYGTIEAHDLSQSRDEESLTPSLTFNYTTDNGAMVYVKGAKGFKSGGFDARSNLQGNFQFEEESVVSYELGSKLTLDEGAAEVNIALFHMSFDDLQTSIYDGQIGFNVKNAGQATTMGLEIDSRWAATDDITVTSSFGWLDFNWDDFKGAKCFSSHALVSPNLSNDGSSCDLTGETNALVPEFSANVGVMHQTEVAEGLLLTSNLDVNYKSDFYTSADLNPFTKQESYAKLNLRIALSNDETWEVALVAKNLTDELTRNFSFDLPLTKGAYANMVEPGRTIGLQFSYDFM